MRARIISKGKRADLLRAKRILREDLRHRDRLKQIEDLYRRDIKGTLYDFSMLSGR